VHVPHDWSIESTPAKDGETGKEWGFYKAGRGEYRRTFDIAEADLAKHLELAFDGVFRNAEVYVNGELAGKGTRYGYTGFRLSLDGKVKMKVDPGTQPGKVLRLRGKGFPALQGYGYGTGDLIVNISVYIPETLSREEKQALEKMQQSDNFRPSQSSKNNFFNRFKQMFD